MGYAWHFDIEINMETINVAEGGVKMSETTTTLVFLDLRFVPEILKVCLVCKKLGSWKRLQKISVA